MWRLMAVTMASADKHLAASKPSDGLVRMDPRLTEML